VISDMRYEAVLTFKYICWHNLIRSCDWLYIYVPFGKQTSEWNYDLSISIYISLKTWLSLQTWSCVTLLFLISVSAVQVIWLLFRTLSYWGFQAQHFGLWIFFRLEKPEMMGSIQNNSWISSDTFKLCSMIIRNI
jgi:hypothetical protein